MADYISREAAIALAKDIIVPTKDGYDYRHRCIDPQDITELPAADVRPVVHEPDDRERICLRAINHFGVEHQKWKLVEELGELLVEIAREHIGRGNKDAIREELADANIMCRQMRIFYGAAKVDGWIRRKLERLVDRMNEEGPDGCE